jgi:hypothetical protein
LIAKGLLLGHFLGDGETLFNRQGGMWGMLITQAVIASGTMEIFPG